MDIHLIRKKNLSSKTTYRFYTYGSSIFDEKALWQWLITTKKDF